MEKKWIIAITAGVSIGVTAVAVGLGLFFGLPSANTNSSTNANLSTDANQSQTQKALNTIVGLDHTTSSDRAKTLMQDNNMICTLVTTVQLVDDPLFTSTYNELFNGHGHTDLTTEEAIKHRGKVVAKKAVTVQTHELNYTCWNVI